SLTCEAGEASAAGAGRSGKSEALPVVGAAGFWPILADAPEDEGVAVSSGLRRLNKRTPLRVLKGGGSGAAGGW
ncbi:hypothetical protein, partial [Asaia sp. SF2.1]